MHIYTRKQVKVVKTRVTRPDGGAALGVHELRNKTMHIYMCTYTHKHRSKWSKHAGPDLMEVLH